MNTPESAPATPPPAAEVPVFERGLWSRTWFMLLLCVTFVILDWSLIPLQVFPIVFIFPVMLVAWNRSIWLATGAAVLLALTRVVHQLMFSIHPLRADDVADMLVCFFVLELLGLLTNLLGVQSRQLRQRVRALEGLLPICSFCKSIRDDRQEWVRFEEYLTSHSEATVSHGLCPECAQKHYAAFLRPKS